MSKRWKSFVRGISAKRRISDQSRNHRTKLRREALSHSVPAEIAKLEVRSLMATGVLGTEGVIGSIPGAHSFSPETDRSVAVDRRGNSIVVWATKADDGFGSKILARRFAFDGTALGTEFTVGWSASANHPNAVVAARDGRFVIAWDAAGATDDASARGVFARVYSLEGTAQTGAFLINGAASGDQFDPSVAWLSADRFVVSWSQVAGQSGRTVFARTFDATGSPVAEAVKLSQAASGVQRHAVVAALPNGQFQAVWSGRGVGDVQGIFTRVFDQKGIAVGPEVLVTGARGSSESQPGIAAGSEQVVIAWQAAGNGADRSGLGIFARRFDLAGKALGSEFRVNQTVFGRQADPAVTIQENGEFVIAWAGRGKGDSSGVFVREFAADGTALGDERLVNASVAGTQSMPALHTRGADGFVVTWSGQGGAARSSLMMRATEEKKYAMPKTTVSARDDVMTFTIPGIGEINKVSPKTMTFTNTTDRTIYPILQGANSNIVTDANSPNFGIGLYDPYDPVEREYRGYVGYIENGEYYLGLKPGETVTINVPLVFWDSGRILFASDGANLIPEIIQVAPTVQKPNSPNPFFYRDFEYFVVNDDVMTRLVKDEKVPQSVADKLEPLKTHEAFQIKDDFEKAVRALLDPAEWQNNSDAIFNVAGSEIATKRYRDDIEGGKYAVMWYQAQNFGGKAEGPSGGAPFQLGEMTFRSDIFKDSAYKTAKDIDPTGGSGETHNLVNYDVSYVDSMTLPVAMQAFEVPLEASGEHTTATASFGWVGANMKIGDIQGPLKNFTSQNTVENPNLNGMGDYFDGFGYPKYYIPAAIEAVTGIKVPAGQNLALESPLKNTKSTWDENRFLITSAGAAPILLGSLGSVNAEGTKIYFASASYMTQLKAIKEALDGGLTVNIKGSLNDLAPGTVVKEVDLTPNGDGNLTVTVDPTNLNAGGTVGGVYDFTRPVVDHVMERLADLWFSWADHYWKAVKDIQPEPGYAGTIAANSNQIKLTTPADPSKLVIGMPVTGAGVGAELKATIMALDLSDDKTKVVSIRISKISKDGGSGDFSIKPVQQIQPQSTEGFKLDRFEMKFGDQAAEDYAVRFARSLYLVMDAMNTVPYIPGQGPAVTQLMANVLGGNIGFVPNIGVSANQPITNPFAASIAVSIRDNVKSILRGVDDFMVDTEESGHWYPDPSLKGDVTGQKINGKDAAFNVYNLNPFVWFVHRKLGLSGYGFSLDDDAADVGADGASKLRIVIGNIDDLPVDQFIKPEWTHGAPFGPVVSSKGEFELIDSGDYKGKYKIKNLDATPLPIAFQVFGIGTAGEPGALVSGPGITPGTHVISPIPTENSVILDKPVTPVNGVVGPFYFSATPPKIKNPATAVKSGRQSWDLSILGADDLYGESALSYSWSLVSGPVGGNVTFAPPQSPASNALKNSQVVISGAPGTYVIRATISQPANVGGFFTTTDVVIKVV